MLMIMDLIFYLWKLRGLFNVPQPEQPPSPRRQKELLQQEMMREEERQKRFELPSFNCAICCERYLPEAMTVPRGHMFCGACLTGWVLQNNSCPLCRELTSLHMCIRNIF